MRSKSLRDGKPRFARQVSFAIAVSILLLVPCFWHRRIEAGDLGSHIYNAWLVTLVEQGRAPGLYVVPQYSNIAVDALLVFFGKRLGFVAAERIVVALCVLIFFWGAFALVTAAAKKPPWFLIPALAMLAYGYTFEMGFFNFYLSIGIAFFAIALVWNREARPRASVLKWIAAVLLALLSYIAHPVGLIVLLGMIAFIRLAQATKGPLRWSPFVLALLAVTALHFYVIRFQVYGWETPRFFLFNGADQVMLFGTRYANLFFALAGFFACAIIFGLAREWRTAARQLVRIPFELWIVLLFFAAVVPELIVLPQYPQPVALFVSRSTSISAVLLLCMLAALRARVWHLAGFAIFAALFFTWLYQDTGELNAIELQAERLLAPLPYGTRIVGTMGPHAGSRLWFIGHLLDRACLGHCFMYSDYEPSSGQFHIRVRPGSRIVTDSAADRARMEFGQYVVKPRDLPLKQVYQCRVEDVDTLCIRDLRAGENNCGNCNSPLYALMHPSSERH